MGFDFIFDLIWLGLIWFWLDYGLIWFGLGWNWLDLAFLQFLPFLLFVSFALLQFVKLIRHLVSGRFWTSSGLGVQLRLWLGFRLGFQLAYGFCFGFDFGLFFCYLAWFGLDLIRFGILTILSILTIL